MNSLYNFTNSIIIRPNIGYFQNEIAQKGMLSNKYRIELLNVIQVNFLHFTSIYFRYKFEHITTKHRFSYKYVTPVASAVPSIEKKKIGVKT